jgi:Helix-turn-helix domain/Glucodextranase, domain B
MDMVRTLATIISESRIGRRMSVRDLSSATKIKQVFIEALESEQWSLLPEYPVVLGFVKRIAQVLEIDEPKLVAHLRRDYPQVPLTISPKQELKTKKGWSPKYSFISIVGICVFVVVAYLTYQYRSFTEPPPLHIINPTEGETITTPFYVVTGTTAADTSVIVNNQPALVEDDGNFYTEIELSESVKVIVVKATSRAGRQTLVTRTITVDLP